MVSTPSPKPLTPRQSRTLGALLGLHAGDSLGASLEFENHSQIKSRHPQGLRDIVGGGPFSWPAGHATDDTDLCRGVLLAYRTFAAKTAPDSINPSEVDIAALAADNFLAWYVGDWPGRKPGSRPVDIGRATAVGLERYRKSRDPARAGSGPGSAGNGSLMRCLPTGLFQRDLELLKDESVRISAVTHEDARCTVSCAAYNAIVAALVAGADVMYAIAAGEAVAVQMEKEGRKGAVYGSIKRGRELSLMKMAEHGPPPGMKGACSGYVLETFSLAIAALLDTRCLEDVLVDVVRVGMDTDTNAAVAGGLLGARDGVEAIPERWRNKLQFADEFWEAGLALCPC